MRHFNIRLFGRVQGVFFRYSAKDKAEELNVKGWARNESDGTVYIEAEGEEEALKNFIKWCRQGSSPAQVEKVEIQEGPMKNFSVFNLVY